MSLLILLIMLWLGRLVFMTFASYLILQTRPEQIKELGNMTQDHCLWVYGLISFLILLGLGTKPWAGLKEEFRIHKFPFLEALTVGLVLSAVLIGSDAVKFVGVFHNLDEWIPTVLALLASGFAALFLFKAEVLCSINTASTLIKPLARKLQWSHRFVQKWGHLLLTSLGILLCRFLETGLHPVEFLNMGILLFIMMLMKWKNLNELNFVYFELGLFFLLHSLFDFPFLGLNLPGIFTLQPQTEFDLFTGGGRGPENGLALTILLIMYALRLYRREEINL